MNIKLDFGYIHKIKTERWIFQWYNSNQNIFILYIDDILIKLNI